tara:strand:- start:393 stop:638 length:246 start_codon:yes stop_codon:yes gene_type:complete
MQKSIEIRVKESGKKSVRTTIDVEYGDAVAKYKIKEIGDLISSINPDAMVQVNFLIYSNVSDTWMEMFSYYADEEKLLNLT